MADSATKPSENSSTKDWKVRYKDLVSEFDLFEADAKESDLTLRKAVDRLGQTFKDSFGRTEQPLVSLAGLIDDNAEAKKIGQAVTDFCIQLSEFTPAELLSGPAKTSKLDYDPEEFEQTLNKLCRQLELKEETIQLVTATAQDQEETSEPSVGPTQRLIALSAAIQDLDDELLDQPLDPAINKLLSQVISNLPKFENLEQKTASLQNELVTCTRLAQLPPILETLAPLAGQIHDEIERERKQAATFLNLIWHRLSDLTDYFNTANKDRQESTDANNMLQDNIHQQVDSLVNQANSAESLPSLQQLLQQSVEQIRSQIDEYVADANPRLQEAELRCQQLSGQVDELREEADKLKQALEQQQREANRDALTNLANRRAFDKLLAHEHRRWKRYGRPLSIIFFDIDHFKSINDKYGHAAGDIALTAIAKILHKSLRENDFLARWGGEEFIALLPDTDEKASLEVAEKLRAAVMATRFHFHDSEVRVTVSCGISEFCGEDDPEQVLNRADEALYQSKSDGRNQSTIANRS
ncbi:MAG: diguanylate cyclase [Immundisolibacteraceae bacterium]|nr:diguanylate cyclase [Immundisolibacteraceae bacterium]